MVSEYGDLLYEAMEDERVLLYFAARFGTLLTFFCLAHVYSTQVPINDELTTI